MTVDPSDRPPPPPLKVVTPSMVPQPAEGSSDVDATWMDRFLDRGMLNVYGSHGRMTRRVRSEVAFAGVLILIQAAIDLLAWFLGLRLVFVNGFGPVTGYPLALTFAGLFAATIAIFERSVLTADVNLGGLFRQPAVYFRMGFVLLASLVTAVPLELFLFQDEIQKVLDRQRGAQVSKAQDLLRGNVDTLIVGVDAALDGDLKRLEAQFAPLRSYELPTVTSVSARLAAVEKQMEHVTGLMQQEDEGRRSGQAGRGKRYKSLTGQLETLNAQLDKLTVTHNAELKQVREDAQTRAAAGEKAFQDAVAGRKAQHEKERQALLAQRGEIETLPIPVLAARARVDIDVADGFSARVRILHQLAAQEPTVEWGIWALRLTMVLFGLLVLIQKATFSTETKAYFSAMAQAAQGDGRLQHMFGGLVRLEDVGSKDRKAMERVLKHPPKQDDQ